MCHNGLVCSVVLRCVLLRPYKELEHSSGCCRNACAPGEEGPKLNGGRSNWDRGEGTGLQVLNHALKRNELGCLVAVNLGVHHVFFWNL